MKSYEEYIDAVEQCFAENRAKDAEILLLSAVLEACDVNPALELQLQNELIGYYRQTSEKEKLLNTIERSLMLAEKLKDENEAYATTLLNVANAYRSIGELEKSENYYLEVTAIYEAILEKTNMLYAGLYNNMSLLYQEKGEYEAAFDIQKKALEIVLQNDAGFEIAVTYANLANTAALLGNIDEAKQYAGEAISRFEERGTIDPHYCAALSALGMCLYREGKYSQAAETFSKAMKIVEETIGKNSQYLRLEENREQCLKHMNKMLNISKLYYEEYGKPMLEEQFKEYLPHMAVGLVGEGSDCFGYDDEFSADHDFGPDFCIWLTDEAYAQIGDKLSEAYAKLPTEFMGYKRTVTQRGQGRRGVLRMSDFYAHFVGGNGNYESIIWENVEDYALAAATNGEVFYDGNGNFTHMRKWLKAGYPERILYLKLAEDVARISQTGQYNYGRCYKRGDYLTANMMLSQCIKQIMLLTHHMNNVYPPHDKWLYKSFCSIADENLIAFVKYLNDCFKLEADKAYQAVVQCMQQLGEYLANELYSRDLISDVTEYLDVHTDELLKKAAYAVCSDAELVQKIAEIEFEAFDKVQNEGGRASCQNNWGTFQVMRKSQYLTWNRAMLMQYIYDFVREYQLGHNLITEKYGRMMESTAPERYAEIKDNFPELSETKKAVIEQIVALQMQMLEEFSKEHPKLAGNARSFYSYEDNGMNTSYETYLRGEISTYSDKMLQLYGRHVADCVRNGRNIAKETISNTAYLYGFMSLEDFEKQA